MRLYVLALLSLPFLTLPAQAQWDLQESHPTVSQRGSVNDAPPCDVNAKVPTSRTFAKTNDDDRWREYSSIKDVPELDLNAGMSAQFWREGNGDSSVYMVQPGDDLWTFTRYCFDKGDRLARVGHEVRTAWGWGYRLEGSIVGTTLHANSSLFFSTKNGKPISKPETANDITDALKPVLYLRIREFPFANLLSGPSKTSGK
jgi:hypothetical protein